MICNTEWTQPANRLQDGLDYSICLTTKLFPRKGRKFTKCQLHSWGLRIAKIRIPTCLHAKPHLLHDWQLRPSSASPLQGNSLKYFSTTVYSTCVDLYGGNAHAILMDLARRSYSYSWNNQGVHTRMENTASSTRLLVSHSCRNPDNSHRIHRLGKNYIAGGVQTWMRHC